MANRWLIQNSCTQPSPTLTDVVGPATLLYKRDKRPALIYHCPKAAVGLGARLTTGTQLHHPTAGGLRAEFEPESPGAYSTAPEPLVPSSAWWHGWLDVKILAGIVPRVSVIPFQCLRPHL